MSISKHFGIDRSVLSVLGLLCALPAVSDANNFTGYRVVSETQNELVLEVQSTYSGSHGQKAYVSVMPTIQGRRSPNFGYSSKNCSSSNDIKVGNNTTCVTLSKVSGPDQITTDGIEACMFNAATRTTFYCRQLAHKKTWGEKKYGIWPQSPGQSVGGQGSVQRSDLTFSKFNIAPLPKTNKNNRLELHMYRSYRVNAAVVNKGTADVSAFKVKTECVRGGRSYSLGAKEVGFLPAGNTINVIYDIFPSSAGGGNCMMRTVIDADNRVAESDESENSNIWKRTVTVLP